MATPTPQPKSPVAIKTDEVLAMAKKWELTHALMGGTLAMREKAEKYLFKWPKEQTQIFTNRLNIATCFPAFKETVRTLVGKPFSRPVALSEDMPARIKALTLNIDMEGRNLDTFAADQLTESIAHGIAGILVDFTPRGEVPNTQAAEAAAGLRPYWVKICFKDVIGWQWTSVGGKKTLTQLRFYETVSEPDPANPFVAKKILQIRVLMVNRYQIWRQMPGKPEEWIKYKDSDDTPGKYTADSVRFVPTYGEYEDFMKGVSPIYELAELNKKHWNSQSDQDNITHVVRAPILAYNSDDPTYELIISPNMGVRMPIGSEMKYVEHTGAAVKTGREELDNLKDEMRQAGAQLLVMREAQATATEISSDTSVGMCALQRTVNGLQDAINLALDYTAKWMGEATGGTVKIFNDFGVENYDQAEAQFILSLSQGERPVISPERVYTEATRRGTLSADISYADEKKKVDAMVKTETEAASAKMEQQVKLAAANKPAPIVAR